MTQPDGISPGNHQPLGFLIEVPLFVTEERTPAETFVDLAVRGDEEACVTVGFDDEFAATIASGLVEDSKLIRRLRQEAPLTHQALVPALRAELRKTPGIA